MLGKLIPRLAARDVRCDVVSMTRTDALADDVRRVARVETLGMSRRNPNVVALPRLISILRRDRPDVLQTWIYQADLLGGAVGGILRIPVLWNVRGSDQHPKRTRLNARLSAKAGAKLSHVLPRGVICCSQAALEIHLAMGYDRSRTLVIPNGFDLDHFRRHEGADTSVRRELGIRENARIVLLAARWDPQKDHRTFVRAARRILDVRDDVAFLLCGTGITWDNQQLARWIDEGGTREHFHLLGRRRDMVRLNSAATIATSSSAYGEGFSNAIGEAMACEAVCLVTNAGNSSEIVGPFGRVVPVEDDASFATALAELLTLDQPTLRQAGIDGRRRITARFDIDRIADTYAAVYEDVNSGASADDLRRVAVSSSA